jgi:hypothetical protein
MTAVGDSIRSKIGKPKRKRQSSDQRRKRRRAADHEIGGRTLVWAAWPPVEIMEIDLPGGGAVRKLWAVSRSRIGAALIPCRMIERGIAEYDRCIIEPRGRVYIGVHGASWSARQDTRSHISILDVACTARIL